jgi:serine/threonine-protein kinase
MDSQRWTKVRAILERALEQEGDQRAAWLARECGDDAQLRSEVESLLASEPGTRAFEPPTRSDVARAIEDRNLGRRVGPYVIERLLGAGGMGAVYLARRADADFEQRVALKLTKRGMDTDEVLAQFRRERALLAALRHPGIAQLYDGGATDDGLPWFAMEYVDGQPIDAWCAARKLSLRQRVQLFIEVCAAVQFAHQNLVVHRDLKPSNILVTASGAPKLLDFGIAKLLASDGANAAQRTLAQQRRLTPDYASPEQLDDEPVTTASDVYSLGVILCELLTGTNPFRGHKRAERNDPPRPSTLFQRGPGVESVRVRQTARELRGDLDTIVTTALAVDMARRYASVEALSAELKRWLDGLPIHARPATAAYLASRFVRRNRVAVAAGTVVFVALVGGLIAARAGYVEAVKQRAVAEQRQKQAELETRRANSALDLTRRMLGGANPDDAAHQDYTLRELLDDFDSELASGSAIEPEVEATVREIMGRAYCELGLTEKAHAHFDRASALRPALRDSLEVLDVSLLRDSVQLMHNESRYDEAVAECDELLERMEPSPVARTVVVEVLQQRGDLKRHLNRLEDADADLRRALAMSMELTPPDESLVAMSCFKLSQVLDQRRQLEEAEQFARRALEIFERVEGRETSDTASAHNMIGFIAEHRHDYAAAQQSFERAVAIERAIHGDMHYRLGPLVDNLGRVHSLRGDNRAAVPLLREAVAIYRATVGPKTLSTATALSNLGRALDAISEFAEGEAAMRECLEIRIAITGEDSTDVARAYHNLGLSLMSRNQFADAEVVLQKALEIRRRLSGASDPSVANTLSTLAITLNARGDLPSSEEAVEQAYAIHKSARKPDPLSLSSAAIGLGSAHMRRYDYEGGIALYREGLEIRLKAFGDKHVDTLRAESTLGEALYRNGQWTESEESLRGAEQEQAQRLGDTHVDIARTRLVLGVLLVNSGRPEEAVCMLRASLEARAKLFGGRSNDTLDVARHLANALDASGAPDQAAAIRTEYSLPVLPGTQ